MAVAEAGSFQRPQFKRNHTMDWIPGWELPASWDVDHYDGNIPPDVPADGQLIVSYRSKNINEKVRNSLKEGQTLFGIERPTLEGRLLTLTG